MRLSIAAIFVIPVIAMLTSQLYVVAQPNRISHENPLTSRISVDPSILFAYYDKVFEKISIGEYEDAQQLIKDIEHADFYAQLRDTIDSYRNSTSSLTSALHKLDPHMKSAESQRTADSAKMSPDDIRTVLLSQQILDELEIATNMLPDKYGGLISLDSQARAHVGDILDKLLWFRQVTGQMIPLDRDIEAAYGNIEPDTTSAYTPTPLEISAPDSVYPGQTITVNCRIGTTDNEPQREAKLFLDDVILYQTPVQYQSSLQAVIPPQVSPGKHTLTVIVEPQEQFAGASAKRPINIITIPVQANIQIPQITILPRAINIDGLISSDRVPLHDAQVEIHLDNNISTVRTTEDGRFSTSVESAHDRFPSGLQRVEITVKPMEPWYSPLKINSTIWCGFR